MPGRARTHGGKRTESEASAVRVVDLGFHYAGRPRPALRDVSFELEPGECLLVLGASGSGKSTLALALAGLIPAEFHGLAAGRVEVGGLDTRVATPGAISARVGLVFQDPASQVVMERVEDDVAFGLESRSWERAAMRRRVPEALDEVGLAGAERRRTRELSGGEQQRLALAGALAPRPCVLVFDEPTANLDPEAAAAFADRLRALRAARAVTIVLVEHRVDLFWSLADRLLVLDRAGRPLAFGAPSEVVDRYGRRLVDEGVWLPEAVERALLVEDAIEATRPPPSARVAIHRSPQGRARVVTASSVSFAYEGARQVLEGVDLAVDAGERVALVGRNGAGKSTLARLLVGLLRPSAGRVMLGGAEPHRLRAPDLARRAGFVFQDPERQFLADTVAHDVMLGLRPDERRRAASLMDQLGLPLDEFGQRSPYRLSGGEKRRLSLATALVRAPDLLVLDEPTFGQDRTGYRELLGILSSLVSGGTAVVVATHDRRLTRDLTSRTIELDAGRITFDGPTAHHVGAHGPRDTGWPADPADVRESAGAPRPGPRHAPAAAGHVGEPASA